MRLKKGDLIYAIAPGYPFEEQGLELATREIEAQGMRLVIPKQILKPSFFHSQTDQMRLSLLVEGVINPKYQAIWAVRGGYGSNRLVSGLLAQKNHLKTQKPKLILGLSDVTSLLYFWTHHLKWVAWHSPVLEAFSRSELTSQKRAAIFEALFGQQEEVSIKLKTVNPKTKNYGDLVSVSGVTGGNLTTIQSHLGTPLKINFKNHFVFLEDTGERGYRIDRMLYQLQESGALKSAKAILFGEFTGGQEMDGRFRIEEALQRFANDYQGPIYHGVPSGHGLGYQVIPMGTPAVIEKGFLKIKYFKK